MPEEEVSKLTVRADNSEMLDEDDDAKDEMDMASLPSEGSTIDDILQPQKDLTIERELRDDEQVLFDPDVENVCTTNEPWTEPPAGGY